MFSLFFKSEDKNSIKLYNTASRKLEVFKPIHSKEVTMYSCGPTVYDFAHIGNLRSYVFADILKRVLEAHNYRVNQTINLTDFGHLTDDADAGEDKMIKAIKRANAPMNLDSMLTVAVPFIKAFKSDMDAMNNQPPSQYARASDYVTEQINLIKALEQKGYTYSTSDGVYFDIAKFPSYGVLGNIDLNAIKAGARVEINEEKRHPADFALWKKGELGWDSKWGKGFPGWHIECTAMVFATLGKQIDIHTGGVDHISTHHNAEIAQAECATGRHYVNYWLHNAHITIDGDKISKSTGSSIYLAEIKEKGFSPIDYRFWLLQSHYRTTANFSYEALEAAKQGLDRLRRTVYEELNDIIPNKINQKYIERFMQSMNNDLNTPEAIAVLFEVAKDTEMKPGEKLATIHEMDKLLGLGLSKSASEGRNEMGYIDMSTLPEDIKALIEERESARKNKNWALSDEIRDRLKNRGFEVNDTKDGLQIRRVG